MYGGTRLGIERTVRTAGVSRWARNVAWRPCAEVTDHDHCYEIRMSVQGVQADRLSVEIRDDVVVVMGRVTPGPFSRGHDESDFHRLIGLPADASRSGATARLEGDLLVVRTPKKRGAVGAKLDLVHPGTIPDTGLPIDVE